LRFPRYGNVRIFPVVFRNGSRDRLRAVFLVVAGAAMVRQCDGRKQENGERHCRDERQNSPNLHRTPPERWWVMITRAKARDYIICGRSTLHRTGAGYHGLVNGALRRIFRVLGFGVYMTALLTPLNAQDIPTVYPARTRLYLNVNKDIDSS